MHQPVAVGTVPVRQSKCLKYATLVCGAISLFFWTICFGFALGYGFFSTNGLAGTGTIILLLVIASYTQNTCRIIFAITAPDFPTPGHLRTLRKCVSRLTSAVLFNSALWIVALIWVANFSIIDDLDNMAYSSLFGCSFSYIFAIVVAALAGAFETRISRQLHSPVGQNQMNPMLGAAQVISGGNPVVIPQGAIPRSSMAPSSMAPSSMAPTHPVVTNQNMVMWNPVTSAGPSYVQLTQGPLMVPAPEPQNRLPLPVSAGATLPKPVVPDLESGSRPPTPALADTNLVTASVPLSSL